MRVVGSRKIADQQRTTGGQISDLTAGGDNLRAGAVELRIPDGITVQQRWADLLTCYGIPQPRCAIGAGRNDQGPIWTKGGMVDSTVVQHRRRYGIPSRPVPNPGRLINTCG